MMNIDMKDCETKSAKSLMEKQTLSSIVIIIFPKLNL